MERIMIKLTDEQKKAMLQLGRTDSTLEMIPQNIIDELVKLGMLRCSIDFTDEGEKVYNTLLHGD